MNDPFPKDGIRFSYLVQEFVPQHRHALTKGGLTTKQVCETIIKPTTSRYQSSYCQMLRTERHPLSTTKSPTAFISHAHSYRFLDVISALQYYFQQQQREQQDSNTGDADDEDDDIVIWFDLFSINQHITNDWSFDWLATTFQSAIGEFGQVIMVMSPWNHPLPFTRAWCVYETYCAAVTNSKFDIALSAKDEEQFVLDVQQNDTRQVMEQMLSKVKAEHCQCFSQRDKRRIFAVIEKQVDGGFTTLNDMVYEAYRLWVIRHALQKSNTVMERISLLRVVGRLYEGQGKVSTALHHYQQLLDLSQSVKYRHKTDEEISTMMTDMVCSNTKEELTNKKKQKNKEHKPTTTTTTTTMPVNLDTVVVNDDDDTDDDSRDSSESESEEEEVKGLTTIHRACYDIFLLQRSHLDVLMCTKNGHYARALSFQTECYNKCFNQLGYSHPTTIKALKNLIRLYGEGRSVEDVPQRFRKEIRDDKVRSAKQLEEYSMRYSGAISRDRLKHAIFLWSEVYYLEKHQWGDAHEMTIHSLIPVIRTLMKAGEKKKAERMLTEQFQAFQNKITTSMDDDVETPDMLHELSVMYQMTENYEMSIELGKVCLDKRRIALGDDHNDTRTSMEHLAALFQATSNLKLSAQTRERLSQEKSKRQHE